MPTLLMIAALAGCDEKLPTISVDAGTASQPEIPAILIAQNEPPIGSALNRRVVRASREVAMKLEPRWGNLQPRILTVAPENSARVGEELRKAMPPGWRAEAVDGVAPGTSRLYGFSSGKEFFGALVIDPEGAPVIPVVILRNRALLDMTKG